MYKPAFWFLIRAAVKADRVPSMAENPFNDDGIAQIKNLLAEVEENLPRVQGTGGIIITDQQTQRIVRTLRILTDQVEQIRTDQNK